MPIKRSALNAIIAAGEQIEAAAKDCSGCGRTLTERGTCQNARCEQFGKVPPPRDRRPKTLKTTQDVLTQLDGLNLDDAEMELQEILKAGGSETKGAQRKLDIIKRLKELQKKAQE